MFSNVTQEIVKKKPEFDVRLLKISNHAESDMYLNLAHKLGKKKPRFTAQTFICSLMENRIEHANSITANKH